MTPEFVEALLRSVQGTSVVELEYETDGHRLRIRRQPDLARAATQSSTAAQAAHAAQPSSRSEAAATVQEIVRAGMHGTFYRASGPSEAPFVTEGQSVREGQQLAFLEAMKMLHAVEADFSGVVVRVLVENGAAVEPGAPLFVIDTSSGAASV
jgi:acetyl-CoA carboxylase biotin carboxyl carrier protein